ncbi:MAG: T9SS type A sorting domain-containing protein [Crocinitomicaceae bacterium]|nr:T9SS type A sorting domain-containing protein [Crocinitomicaceae bacterium]
MKKLVTQKVWKSLAILSMTFFSFTSIAQDLSITVDVCDSASEVRMTGPFWGWDPTSGPFATDNGNGTWTFTLSPAPTTNMEYLVIVDGIQENLVEDMLNGGSCAPVTDYFSYANRIWNVGDGDVTGISYDRCVSCAIDDLVITTEICDTTITVNQLSLTGPIWSWDPNLGPDAVDNGNGTWSFTFSPAPTDSLEYLLVLDGTFENLISDMVNGGTCAPNTDYSTYANRLWTNGAGNVFNTFDQCFLCAEASIDETAFETLSVFPVPASDVIYVKDETTIGNIVIYSVDGKKVIEREVNDSNASISIHDLNPGVYYLTVYRDGASSVHQIVKQ